MTAPTTIAADLRARPAWQALERHYAEIEKVHLRELFAADPLTPHALGALVAL